MDGAAAQPSGRLIGKRAKPSDGAPASAATLPPIDVPARARPAPGPADALAPADGERALVMLPGGEPTDRMVEAVAAAFGLTAYEARMRVREPLPRVTTIGPADEVQGVADALRDAGVGVEVLDGAPLTGPLRPFPVQRLLVEGDRLHASGPRGEVTVDLRQPALLVGGRFEFKAVVQSGFRRGEAVDMVLFGHLYAGGWADPLELVESGIQGWDFLGASKSPARRTNFQKTLELLRRWPSVTWNDALLQHPGRIKDSLHGLAGKGHFLVTGAGGASVTERSNQGGADLLSRVLYQLWRARLGDRVAAHDGALTVVSVLEDTTDERLKAAFGGGPSALDLAHANVRKAAAEASAPPRPVSGRSPRAAALIAPDPASAPPTVPAEPTSRRPSSRLGHADPRFVGDPTRPMRPNPPGAPPVTLLLRGLSLQGPNACVCCLAPPARRPIEACNSQTDWESVASSTLGVASFLALGSGWVRVKHEETVILRMPACADCYRHETSNELAWIVAAVGTFVGFLATLGKIGIDSGKAVAFVLVAWGVALIVLGLLLSMLLARRGPRCSPTPPLRLKHVGNDFKVRFGNQSFGERIAELNAELVERKL